MNVCVYSVRLKCAFFGANRRSCQRRCVCECGKEEKKRGGPKFNNVKKRNMIFLFSTDVLITSKQ